MGNPDNFLKFIEHINKKEGRTIKVLQVDKTHSWKEASERAFGFVLKVLFIFALVKFIRSRQADSVLNQLSNSKKTQKISSENMKVRFKDVAGMEQ